MICKLDVWLKKRNNSLSKLAFIMGYSNTSAVEKWIKRRSIPFRSQPKLKKVLAGKIKAIII